MEANPEPKTQRGPNMGGLPSHPTLRLWREHKQNLANFKDTTFQVLAHPDATPEMIEAVRIRAIHIYKQHLDILNKMRAAGFNVD